jgi:MFS family permease
MLTVKEPSNIEVELADSDGTPSGSKCEEDNAAAADAVATKHSMRFHLAFLTILICNFIVSLNQVSIAASLSTIAAEFKASTNDAYWCAIGYELAQTVSQPIVGSLSEVFGRKIMLQTSLTIFLVASVLCARAESIHWLIGARVVCFPLNDELFCRSSTDTRFRYRVLVGAGWLP